MIQSFSIKESNADTTLGELKFKVVYYSDSTERNIYSTSIEKGQKGSDQQIVFFGQSLDSTVKSADCAGITLGQFITSYNSKQKMYRGENLEKVNMICIKGLHLDNVFLVLKENTLGDLDTLYNEGR
ncbi:MAG: hypothetical protein NT150_01510 [Bacteroidetes bacterium]|nr:hypothetical protein [Bacteroidota bacterium]